MIKWNIAKQDYNLLIDSTTWELILLPPNCLGIGCKFVLRTKRDIMGQILRYKIRLVAKGCSQVARVEFNEIFLSWNKFTTNKNYFSI